MFLISSEIRALSAWHIVYYKNEVPSHGGQNEMYSLNEFLAFAVKMLDLHFKITMKNINYRKGCFFDYIRFSCFLFLLYKVK